MSLIVLEAFEHIHAKHAAEYERRGAKVQAKVKELEPDMLVHLQTRVSESDDEIIYRWLEVFRNEDGLSAHFTGDHVVTHLEYLMDGVISRPSVLKLHVDWSEEHKERWRERLPGVEFVPPTNAYFREA